MSTVQYSLTRQEALREITRAEKEERVPTLAHANLSKTDLHNADLSGGDIREANLSDADLSKAYICGAYLLKANSAGRI